MSEKILMITPEGEKVKVDSKNFDVAVQRKLEPALEYVTPQGETVLVRKKNFAAAEKKGLVMKPLYEAKQTPMESPGKVASFAAGAAQWSPLGAFREEISAATQEPMGAARAVGQLFGIGSKEDPKLQAYQKAKQQYKDVEDAAWEQEPVSYSAGGLLSALGLGGAGAASKAPTLAKTALTGAGYGAASGVGEAEGDIGDLAKSGAIGGVAGGALGAGASGLQALLAKGAEPLSRQASRSAYSATGALKSDINKLYNNTPEQVGRELLDQKIVRPFTARGSEAINDRIGQSLGRFGDEQTALINRLDEMAPDSFDTKKLVEALFARSREQSKLPGVGNQALADRLQKEADVLKQVYGGVDELGEALDPRQLSMAEALDLKRAYDKSGKFQSPMSQADAVEAAREARSLARNQIDDTVSRIAGPEVMAGYKQSREGASKLMSAKDAVDQSLKRDQAKSLGLRESIFGSVGATIGSATGGPVGAGLGAIAGAAASKLSKKYSDAVAATMLDRASKILKSEGFDAGMKTLVTIYGQDAARDIGEAIVEQGNFGDPRQSANLLGSAVLGRHLGRRHDF